MYVAPIAPVPKKQILGWEDMVGLETGVVMLLKERKMAIGLKGPLLGVLKSTDRVRVLY